MSDILSNPNLATYDPGSIRRDDTGVGVTYKDSRGIIRSVNSSNSNNMEAVLGANWGGKLAGSLWEASWKTAATLIPAGKTWKLVAALTTAKIAVKGVGSAGNYYLSGDYSLAKSIKKGLITNLATPTNYAPLLNSNYLKNTKIGQTFGSYYTTLSGDGHSSNILQKNRLDFFNWNPKWGPLKGGHYHGSVYPINPLLQAESKVIGGGFYNIISGKHPFQLAQANAIHNNDNQHIAMMTDLNQQGGSGHSNIESHAQAEPQSGGAHSEGAYQAAFLPFSVEVTRKLNDWVKEGYENSYTLESGIVNEHAVWKNKVYNADGAIDTVIEFVKGAPNEIINNQLLGLVYLNRYITRPVVDIVTEGLAESVQAIDSFAANLADFGLAAGATAYANVKDFLTPASFAGAQNPYDEVAVVTDIKGNKKAVTVARARQDAVKVNKPNPAKLLKDIKAEEAQNTKKFGFIIDRLKAANIEKATGIKVGTAGNPLAGQPFANNTPQMRNSVFGTVNTNRSITTVSQTRK
jgi:hypothetical protein